jgi:hypothetical protein
MAKRKVKIELSDEDWIKKKASQLRSSWLARSKKHPFVTGRKAGVFPAKSDEGGIGMGALKS